jgi:hypothetical protein
MSENLDLGTKIDVINDDGWQKPTESFNPVNPTEVREMTEVVKKKVSKAKKTTESSQIKKFREIFGLKRVDVKYIDIIRLSLDGKSNTTTKFGIRGLNHADLQWCVEKAESKTLKQAVVAMSICSMDDVPIWKVFGLSDENITDPNYPDSKIRIEAADLLYIELKNTLFDLVEELHAAIMNLMDSYTAKEEEKQEVPLA